MGPDICIFILNIVCILHCPQLLIQFRDVLFVFYSKKDFRETIVPLNFMDKF